MSVLDFGEAQAHGLLAQSGVPTPDGPVGMQPAAGAAADVLARLGLGGSSDLKAQLLRTATQNPGAVIDLRSSSSGPAAQSSDPAQRLQKLTEVKDQGLVTDTEFAAARAKILGEI